jgi:microcystin-dependent protein
MLFPDRHKTRSKFMANGFNGQPYVGEIRMFGGNFAPVGWLFCDGALLNVGEYQTLFQLIGTTYGGDGTNTFALPDLRGRVPIHTGQGFEIAQKGGSEKVTLRRDQIPSHNHGLTATGSGQIVSPNESAFPASVTPARDLLYGPPGGAPGTFNASTIGNAGGGGGHNNIQPYVAINFIISLFGIFPTQT